MTHADGPSDAELLPVGTVRPAAVREVQQTIERNFDLELARRERMELPAAAYDESREQYVVEALLPAIEAEATPGPTIGVTGADLLADGRDEILGVNRFPGTTLLLSTNRLWTSDTELFRERLRKEAVHLVATMFLADHCAADSTRLQDCVHQYTPTVAALDRTPETLCIACQAALSEHVR